MPAPAKILRLVEQFGLNIDAYHSGHYNEAQVRREYIDPFWKELGWDIDNTQGHAEAYKDVIHEDAIKIGSATKAPDYSFRVGGARKFFLEAKKPSIWIKGDPAPAYQLRRYAWSAKLPLSVLTDFEELAVYDCRIKPDESDKASAARTMYVLYTEYAYRWDEIAGIFSRDAVLKGSFDKYAEKSKGKKGTATVDKAFLETLGEWRVLLAQNLALRNPKLSQRELNYAVQVTLDRIIFLRMCEDRGIEVYGRLLGLVNGPKIYPRLQQFFRDADDKYNSGLFYLRKERDRADDLDTITPGLEVDDKALKEIIKALYYPECPYEFSVLSAEILGQVYEQFLGQVIRLTAGHRAQVEDKPEVKKAGGVYYTPSYIVDYIVKHTVGKLLDEPGASATGESARAHEDVLDRARASPPVAHAPGSPKNMTPKEAAKLRVLDPACGSGSFLLGAYQYLLDWHRDWYVADGPEKHRKEIYGARGGWRLTTGEKKRILLNNIYGVDIDPQAVEVTKLSLLLKVLEGESQESLDRQRRLFHERALPDLANNIKCGNSLIGPDFYDGQQTTMFDEEERYRINVFDWNAAFPKIMKAGGFDAVIGNPPYVRQEGVSRFKDYFSRKFESYHGLADLYVFFFERCLRLANNRGQIGLISSGKFTQSGYGAALRNLLLRNQLESIVDYGDLQIFAGATTYPVIAHFRPKAATKSHYLVYAKASRLSGPFPDHIIKTGFKVSQGSLSEAPWIFVAKNAHKIFEKLTKCGETLSSLCGPAQQGIKTSLNEAFVVDAATAKRLIKEDNNAKELIRPYGRGRDVSKWFTNGNGSFLLCSREATDIKKFGSVYRHLAEFRKALSDRYEVRRGDYEWWVIRQVSKTDIYDNPKVVYPDLCSRPEFALNLDGMYPNNTVFSIATANKSVLAYLNSKLAWYWIVNSCPSNRGGAFRLFNHYMNKLPVSQSIAESEPLAKACNSVIMLSQSLAKAKAPQDRKALEAQIAATDRQIDKLVYELYGLTEEEIKIVEEGTAG